MHASCGQTMMVGAAQEIITPEVGGALAGWVTRAAGDLLSRRVHDDLYVKALAVEGRDGEWIALVADILGVDSTTTEQIRAGVSDATGVPPMAVMICATHGHSGPAVSSVATAVAPDTLTGLQPDGSVEPHLTRLVDYHDQAESHARYEAGVDIAWRERFVAQAVLAASCAWSTRDEAEVCFGEAKVAGVASSRRVLLSDGTWADPRRTWRADATVVHRSEIDEVVRTAFFRRVADGTPLAALVNYSTHPWVFFTASVSAELAGVVAHEVARRWSVLPGHQPTVLYLTGVLGDATLIWNIDIDSVWRSHPAEDPSTDLERRERGFHSELTRLGRRVAHGAQRARGAATDWHVPSIVRAERRAFTVPLKPGYVPDRSVRVATWQQNAPVGEHLTEIQLLRLGRGGILGLPGEPFAALGRAIRSFATLSPLLIAAPANDFGALGYLMPEDEYVRGGYEQIVSPAGLGSGERLVAAARALLSEGQRSNSVPTSGVDRGP